MSEISASIQETNAIRAKLGLKPLKEGPETSGAKLAEDNLKRQREEEAQKAREDAIKNKIAKARTKRELSKVLSGKGLGEASDEDDTEDVYKWTVKSRNKEKERRTAEAARRERELQELDEVYQQEYDENHLAGLRVGHDITDFQEGEERILTLKDSTILENEENGDELINIQMSERERLEKNLENKKKKNRPVYSGYDDDEFLMGKKKGILSQYDEVLGTETGNDGFVLGKVSRPKRTTDSQRGSTSQQAGLSAKEIMNQKLKESAIALTYDKTQQAQDYYTKDEAEVSFKKSKKKKKSRSRKTDSWEDDENQDDDAMQVERSQPVDISELNFVDDEDLQASLTKARRAATKRTLKTLTPEQIAKNIAESMTMEMDQDDTQKGGLVISDVSEFVSNLSSSAVQISSSRPTPLTRAREQSAEAGDIASLPVEEGTKQDSDMEDVNGRDEETDSRSRTRAASEDSVDKDVSMKPSSEEEQSTTESVLVDEPLVSRGLGSTLALLKQKGAYETGSAEQAERAKVQAERAKWLAESRLREAKLAREMVRDKQRDKERSKDKNYSIRDRERDREYENQRREQQLLDEREARMKNYKPDIKLEYIDESGNRLNTKEAFRQLSHAFHGKTSGKMKTEKRMKKLEDEKRLLGMSSTDTPLNMVSAFQERQKAAGSAHIVLAVGNRK
ncbi:SART-1 protein [Gamsiella multidivaricata]|uniref:SART-1 protein n=1 Tax=Gamsiella multidivaricata TaxID=101098 RepID=UPI0022202C79|nr:SART-1 protein [Gamsiella multidivaricata]KAI7816915.1 SART-1 protein [Gamsiella multidivaricata]